MFARSPSVALLLILQSSAPALAQPTTAPGELTGVPRFSVTADAPREVREVRIGPGLGTLFVFDTPVQREGVVVQERGHFRQVSLSEDGLLLTLLPSGELPLGRRLELTVRFTDGAPPTSVDFVLVVSPRAEPQVEVYRLPRPGDSYRREAEEAQTRLQQCQTELRQDRARRDAPRGLMGLLASEQMGREGIPSMGITKDVTLRAGEAFRVEQAVSYRATGGVDGARVVRLAVELVLRNKGTQPWTPAHAELVGQGWRWAADMWAPEPIAPGEVRRVLVELTVGEAHGPYLLQLWDESGTRTVTLSGVTFP
jgi:uncharacterized protein (TIGR02268 family)